MRENINYNSNHRRSSPHLLALGGHGFTVRVADVAGNTGEDQSSWTVGSPPSNNGGVGGSRNR